MTLEFEVKYISDVAVDGVLMDKRKTKQNMYKTLIKKMYDMIWRCGIVRRKQVKSYWQWTWVFEMTGIDIKAWQNFI